jgi:hypothetical protein
MEWVIVCTTYALYIRIIQVLKVIKILPGKLILETEILVHSRMNSNSRYKEGWMLCVLFAIGLL